MKRRANSLLTLVSMAFMGIFAMLATATPAMAAPTWTLAGSNNGVTCYLRTGGTSYPEVNNNFQYCGNSIAHRDATFAAFMEVMNSYPHVKNTLAARNSGNGAKFYFYKDAVEQQSFAHSGTPTQTELDQWYAEAVAADAFGQTVAHESVVYERVPTNDPLDPWSPIDLARNKHTMLHEMGHNFDLGRSTPSASSAFRTMVEHDQVRFDAAAGPTQASPSSLAAPAIRVAAPEGQTKAILLRHPATDPAGIWGEVYAEQFAGFMIANKPAIGASEIPALTLALKPYFNCSAMWIDKNVTLNRDPNDRGLNHGL